MSRTTTVHRGDIAPGIDRAPRGGGDLERQLLEAKVERLEAELQLLAVECQLLEVELQLHELHGDSWRRAEVQAVLGLIAAAAGRKFLDDELALLCLYLRSPSALAEYEPAGRSRQPAHAVVEGRFS